MIFQDRDETETRNLDREMREIETETRVSSNPGTHSLYLKIKLISIGKFPILAS